jgi:hypothetical protein
MSRNRKEKFENAPLVRAETSLDQGPMRCGDDPVRAGQTTDGPFVPTERTALIGQVNGGPYTVVYDRIPALIHKVVFLDCDPSYGSSIALAFAMPQLAWPNNQNPLPDGSGDADWFWPSEQTADYSAVVTWGNGDTAHSVEVDVREGQTCCVPAATVEVVLYSRCVYFGEDPPEPFRLGASASYGAAGRCYLTQEAECYWVANPGIGGAEIGLTDGTVYDSNLLPGSALANVGAALGEALAAWG